MRKQDYNLIILLQLWNKTTTQQHIINDLDYWPKLPLRSFTLKNRLFGAINIVKDGDKEKYVYGTYGMAFNEKGLWTLNDGFARNAIIFRG